MTHGTWHTIRKCADSNTAKVGARLLSASTEAATAARLLWRRLPKPIPFYITLVPEHKNVHMRLYRAVCAHFISYMYLSSYIIYIECNEGAHRRPTACLPGWCWSLGVQKRPRLCTIERLDGVRRVCLNYRTTPTHPILCPHVRSGVPAVRTPLLLLLLPPENSIPARALAYIHCCVLCVRTCTRYMMYVYVVYLHTIRADTRTYDIC